MYGRSSQLLEISRTFTRSAPVIPRPAWPGVGARDEVHYRSGWVYHRHFTHWTDRTGYELDIGAIGEETSHVSWRLHPLDDKNTRLTIEVWPRPVSPIPGLRQFLRFVIVGPLMRKYLKSVTAGVNWFVTSDEPVKKINSGRTSGSPQKAPPIIPRWRHCVDAAESHPMRLITRSRVQRPSDSITEGHHNVEYSVSISTGFPKGKGDVIRSHSRHRNPRHSPHERPYLGFQRLCWL